MQEESQVHCAAIGHHRALACLECTSSWSLCYTNVIANHCLVYDCRLTTLKCGELALKKRRIGGGGQAMKSRKSFCIVALALTLICIPLFFGKHLLLSLVLGWEGMVKIFGLACVRRSLSGAALPNWGYSGTTKPVFPLFCF